ncbi:MAG: PQQ-binding-like beta-propeller repeat protein, partial [Brevinematales bacterium]
VEGKVSVKPKVTAIEKAKEEARVDTRAYDALQNAIAPAVEVGAEEEVVLQKEVVEKINQKVAEVINEKTTAGGPLTGEKVEEVKQSVVKEVVKEVVGGRSGETPSLVGVVVQKKVITEESKQILENVRQKEPVGKKRVKVSFSSDVPGTIVVIDGLKVGKVPFSKVVDVDATYTVVFEKEGYQSVSQEVKITSPTNIGVKMISLGASGTGVQEMVAQSSETNQQPEKPSLKPGEMEWEKPLEEMVSPTMVVVDRGGVDVDRMVWSVENRIVIMNLEGEVLKSFVLGKGNTYDFPVVATSTGIFARDDDGVVYGYDYNGNQKWLVKLPKSPAWTGLGVAKNKLIIPVVQNKVYVLSVELGEIVSTIEGTGQIYASPVMVDNKILVYAQENGMVVGYDMERGEELWRKDLGKRFVLPLYGCSEGEKKVAVLPIQGKLIAIDALSGNVVWEKEMVGATFATKPIARGGFLYVVNKNRLEVIDMLSGETRGKFTMASDIISFQVEKSKIYLLDATGQMKAFGPGGGVLWSYNAGSGGQGLAVHPEGVYVFTKKAVVKLVNELPEKK